MINLGQRMLGVIAALSGTLAIKIDENTAVDNRRAAEAEAALLAVGEVTTDLNNKITDLAAVVAAGQTIDPAAFAEVVATIASLNEAFPDATVAPPEDDPVEEPVVDEGTDGDPEPEVPVTE